MTKIKDHKNGQYGFKCPGCGGYHLINTDPKNGIMWQFNGDLKKPTFSPSILAQWGKYASQNWTPPKNWDPTKTGFYDPSGQCHFFIRAGMIQFCGDCTHELKGQTVEMEDAAP